MLLSLRSATVLAMDHSLDSDATDSEKQWRNTSSTTLPPTDTCGGAYRAKITKVCLYLSLGKFHLE